MPEAAVLTISDALVRYGETVAVDGVSLAIGAGTIHALIGENGAGKSTLLRAIAGVTPLDRGTIASPRPLRIEWVPQELALALDLTVSETIFLGRELRNATRLLRRTAMQRKARAALAQIGCTASATTRVGELSAPVRKQVQLARAFAVPADVLLLDEPTAVLGRAESDLLFAAIRRARDAGTAIVYVSHQIDEVLAISNTVTVLRDGQHVSTDPVAAIDAATIVTRMVGRPLAASAKRSPVPKGAGVALRVRGLFAPPLRDISFVVAAGEIVGLAGLVGAGRSELLDCIAGASPRSAGDVEVRGTMALVPEDRLRNGLIPTLSLRENIFLPAPARWLRARREEMETDQWIERLRVRTRGAHALPAALSGGNQQKVLLARALRRAPDVLMLDDPTAGVDVGAKADIHSIIRAQAETGAAVVIASSELLELLALCDRVIALRQGAQVGTLAIGDADEPRLAALITGAA
ncbi:MAG: sugar ABC transporter ATP-binding protein [Deltaproteobacteria bacterium]|nr:sugar ABC transporter ATP-binding protein [Deltaproteobacteria bacterium]